MIDCGTADDVCLVKNQIEAEVRPATDEMKLNAMSFDLGEFNGRVYTYTWFGGMPTITIEDVDKTAFPADALVSDVPDDIF